MLLNKRGSEEFISKQVIYWILIGASIIVAWVIIKAIINRLLSI